MAACRPGTWQRWCPRWSTAPRAGTFRVSSRLEVGLAWHRSPVGRGRLPVMWHNGGTGGFRSFVAFTQDADVAVAVPANSLRSVDRLGVRLLEVAAAG